MTTTTTTTTVILITTAQTIMALGVIATIILMFAIIIRELSVSYRQNPEVTFVNRVRILTQRERVKTLGKNMVVAIVPLFLIFALVVVVKIVSILST